MSRHETFADEIRRRRVRLGMTQAGMAAALGASSITCASWERADTRPSGLAQEAVRARLDDIERRLVLDIITEHENRSTAA